MPPNGHSACPLAYLFLNGFGEHTSADAFHQPRPVLHSLVLNGTIYIQNEARAIANFRRHRLDTGRDRSTRQQHTSLGGELG